MAYWRLTILNTFSVLPVTGNFARDGVNGITPGGRPWNISFVPLSGLKRIMADSIAPSPSYRLPSGQNQCLSSILWACSFQSFLTECRGVTNIAWSQGAFEKSGTSQSGLATQYVCPSFVVYPVLLVQYDDLVELSINVKGTCGVADWWELVKISRLNDMHGTKWQTICRSFVLHRYLIHNQKFFSLDVCATFLYWSFGRPVKPTIVFW